MRLVHTTHTEKSAIPLHRFVLLPNTAWESEATGGCELLLLIRGSILYLKAITAYKRILLKCHLTQSSQVGHLQNLFPHGKVWLRYTEPPGKDHGAS